MTIKLFFTIKEDRDAIFMFQHHKHRDAYTIYINYIKERKDEKNGWIGPRELIVLVLRDWFSKYLKEKKTWVGKNFVTLLAYPSQNREHINSYRVQHGLVV